MKAGTTSRFTVNGAFTHIFYVLSCQLVTMDDKLMETRCKSSPMKLLSALKMDREGQTSDVLAHALFCPIIDYQHHVRRESQKDSFTSLLRSVTYRQGEISSLSPILTPDRSFRKPSFLSAVEDVGFRYVFIINSHFIQVHPYISTSHLRAGRQAVLVELGGG